MPFAYTIIAGEEHVAVEGTGKVTTAECVAAINKMVTDPAYRPHYTVLLDARELSYTPREATRVAEAIAGLRESFANNVAVVDRGPHLLASEALALMLRTSARINIRVFVDVGAAEAFCRQGRAEKTVRSKKQGRIRDGAGRGT